MGPDDQRDHRVDGAEHNEAAVQGCLRSHELHLRRVGDLELGFCRADQLALESDIGYDYPKAAIVLRRKGMHVRSGHGL